MNRTADEPASNPYAPPREVSRRPPSMEVRRPGRWLIRLCSLQLVVIVSGVSLAVLDIETIVLGGPIVACTGLAIALVAGRRREMFELLLGLSAIALAVLVTLLITVNRWSPTQADRPVTLILAAYALLAVPALLAAVRRQRSKRNAPRPL